MKILNAHRCDFDPWKAKLNEGTSTYPEGWLAFCEHGCGDYTIFPEWYIFGLLNLKGISS